jgi:hypothetical protein
MHWYGAWRIFELKDQIIKRLEKIAIRNFIIVLFILLLNSLAM